MSAVVGHHVEHGGGHVRRLPLLVGVAVTMALAVWSPTALSQAAAAPYTTGYRYDGGSRLVGTILPDPDGTGPIKYAAVRNTYSARGLLARVEEGELAAWKDENVLPSAWGAAFTVFQQVDYAYDIYERQLTAQSSGVSSGTASPQTTTQTTYDSMGRVQCVAQRMSISAFSSLPASACTLGTQGTQGPDRITQSTYDILSRPLLIVKALGTSDAINYATYTYYPDGPLKSVSDANNNYTYYAYDNLVRLYRQYFPSKTTAGQYSATDYEEYGYDPNGNRLSFRKRDNSVINYQYDALNRVTFKDIPGSTLADVYYDYDLRGLQLSAFFGLSSGSGASSVGIATTYNGFGGVTASTNNSDGVSRTLSYQYDAEGHRLRITHPDAGGGVYFTYGYDGLNRVTSICEATSPCTGMVNPLASFTYDNQGRRYALSRGSNVATTSYAYDPVSRLQTLSHNLDGTGTANDVSFGFTYTPASQVGTRNITNGSYSYTTGPAKSTLYTPNGLDQYSIIFAASTITPTYDPNANMTWDGAVNYGYDVENRLIGATVGKTANLYYDPNGRLLSVNAGTTTSDTHYLYDGDALVAEYNSSGTLLRRYVHGPGVDEPLVWYEGATVGTASRYYLFGNHQGSIAVVINSSGAMTRINTYDVYGVPGLGNGGTFQYTGQIWLAPVGLYYYKARIYNPTLGRFMQTDPIGYKDDVDLYTYVGNDPLDKTDPSGLWAGFDDAIAIGAGVLLGVVAQASEDLSSGHLSSSGEYAASAAGGALAGELALYAVLFGPAGLAGAVALGSVAADSLKSLATGENLNAKGVAIGAVIAVATAGVPGVKSAAGALFKQLATKAKKGLIRSATNQASAKAIAGKVAEDARGAFAEGIAADSVKKFEIRPKRCARYGLECPIGT